MRKAAQGLVLLVAVHPLGALVPEGDLALELPHHDGVMRQIEQLCLIGDRHLLAPLLLLEGIHGGHKLGSA